MVLSIYLVNSVSKVQTEALKFPGFFLFLSLFSLRNKHVSEVPFDDTLTVAPKTIFAFLDYGNNSLAVQNPRFLRANCLFPGAFLVKIWNELAG